MFAESSSESFSPHQPTGSSGLSNAFEMLSSWLPRICSSRLACEFRSTEQGPQPVSFTKQRDVQNDSIDLRPIALCKRRPCPDLVDHCRPAIAWTARTTRSRAAAGVGALLCRGRRRPGPSPPRRFRPYLQGGQPVGLAHGWDRREGGGSSGLPCGSG